MGVCLTMCAYYAEYGIIIDTAYCPDGGKRYQTGNLYMSQATCPDMIIHTFIFLIVKIHYSKETNGCPMANPATSPAAEMLSAQSATAVDECLMRYMC